MSELDTFLGHPVYDNNSLLILEIRAFVSVGFANVLFNKLIEARKFKACMDRSAEGMASCMHSH